MATEHRSLTKWAERAGLALAFVGVLAVVVWMLVLTRSSSERAAEAQAQRIGEVERCYTLAAAAPGTHDVLTAIEIIARNQLNHLLTDDHDRARTFRALEAPQSFHAQQEATAPTARECRLLAERLGVERPS